MDKDMAGKVALVTGGSSGIGLAAWHCRRSRQCGCLVVFRRCLSHHRDGFASRWRIFNHIKYATLSINVRICISSNSSKKLQA